MGSSPHFSCSLRSENGDAGNRPGIDAGREAGTGGWALVPQRSGYYVSEVSDDACSLAAPEVFSFQ